MKTSDRPVRTRTAAGRLPVLIAVCATLALGRGPAVCAVPEGGTYAEDEARVLLRSELADFDRYIDVSVKDAHNILKKRKIKADDLARFDAWQSAQLARLHEALRQEDPLTALVDAWAISGALSRYVKQVPSQAELPESVRDVAFDMLKRREDRLVHIARRYLPEESVAALSKRIEAFTASQPIAAGDMLTSSGRGWTSPLFSVWTKGQSAVGSVLQLPLMPGRALMGVSESGKALSGIRESTAEAVQVASELPERIRAEFQLALASVVTQREEIIEILAAVDAVATNLVVTAEATRGTAMQVQKSLALARELLPAGEALADAVDRAVKSSTGLLQAVAQLSGQSSNAPGPAAAEGPASFDVKEYEAAAAALTVAANEVRGMLAEIRALIETARDRADAEKKDDGFDIREYRATAESIECSAIAIRGILSDWRELTDDEAFRRRVALLWNEADAIAGRIAARADGVIDHLTVRLLQAAVAVFVLVCLCAAFRARLTQRAERDGRGH